MKKPIKFAVCGDSFAAPVTLEPIAGHVYHENARYVGQHFSEVMASELGWELFPLARGGNSNGAIRLQVETAIAEGADFIWVTDTGHERIEFRADRGKEFDWRLGVYNIDMRMHGDLSSLNPKFHHNLLNSETLSNMLPGYREPGDQNRLTHHLGPDKIDAILHYWKQLYDSQYKHRQDSWILSGMITELKLSGIPFLYVGNEDMFEYPEMSRLISDNVVVGDQLPIWPRTFSGQNDIGSRFHTGVQEQRQIASATIKYIKKKGLIDV